MSMVSRGRCGRVAGGRVIWEGRGPSEQRGCGRFSLVVLAWIRGMDQQERYITHYAVSMLAERK